MDEQIDIKLIVTILTGFFFIHRRILHGRLCHRRRLRQLRWSYLWRHRGLNPLSETPYSFKGIRRAERASQCSLLDHLDPSLEHIAPLVTGLPMLIAHIGKRTT